jgi:hypothetical protein
MGDLFERQESYTELPGDYAAVAAFVESHGTQSR